LQTIKKIKMKNSIILLALLFAFVNCKGPKSGPLVKENFTSTSEAQGPAQAPMAEGSAHMGQVTAEKLNVVVEPCDGCLTIAKLMENKKTEAGKVIRVKGSVTKFNPQIMGKNWIHIQDGSEFNGTFDLTITTDQEVTVGQTITFEGKISLDKDFGYGYSYNVLMEEAKIIQ
jgi:hypothetical protein